MEKAARTDNGAEPGRSAWGGRCCGVHHRRRFHELALGGGSGPHTAFIQSKHGEGKQWRRFHTHPSPLPHSTTSHHRHKKKNNGAKVMMRVKVWTRQLLQEVMTGTRNNARQLVFSESHLLERSLQSLVWILCCCQWKFGCMVNLIDDRFCPELNCPELMHYFITEF